MKICYEIVKGTGVSGYFKYVMLYRYVQYFFLSVKKCELQLFNNGSYHVKWLCKRWSRFELLMVILRYMSLQISLVLP